MNEANINGKKTPQYNHIIKDCITDKKERN